MRDDRAKLLKSLAETSIIKGEFFYHAVPQFNDISHEGPSSPPGILKVRNSVCGWLYNLS